MRAVALVSLLALSSTLAFSNQDDELRERIDAVGAAAVAGGVPGLSILVAMGDEVLVADSWGRTDEGPARPGSAYRCGALTGTFLIQAALGLAEDGRLDLDAELKTYFPELEFGGETVTVAQLLSHTSGLPEYRHFLEASRERIPDPKNVLAWLANAALDSEPGTCYAYSETNSLLLGLILETITERPVPALLAQSIFEPTEMQATIYCSDGPYINERAATTYETSSGLEELGNVALPFESDGLCSTVEDLFAWTRSLVERRSVVEATFTRMTSPVLRTGAGVGAGCGFNLMSVGPYEGVSCGGGQAGGRAHVAYYPGVDLCIAVLACSEDAPVAAIERRLARAVLDLPEPGVQDLELSAAQLAVYAGDYYIACDLNRILVQDGHLVALPAVGSSYRLLAQGDHVFVAAKDAGIVYTFEVVGERTTKFLLEQNGTQSVGVRMD
jgi:CubicO group peptidase (beta-lactamase class C family)